MAAIYSAIFFSDFLCSAAAAFFFCIRCFFFRFDLCASYIQDISNGNKQTLTRHPDCETAFCFNRLAHIDLLWLSAISCTYLKNDKFRTISYNVCRGRHQFGAIATLLPLAHYYY